MFCFPCNTERSGLIMFRFSFAMMLKTGLVLCDGFFFFSTCLQLPFFFPSLKL